jgi:hypothetical protein
MYAIAQKQGIKLVKSEKAPWRNGNCSSFRSLPGEKRLNYGKENVPA